MTTLAYIALGSNMGDRAYSINKAIQLLLQKNALKPLRLSPLYETAAVGIGDNAPSFLNGVFEAETSLSPTDLLHHLLSVEQSMGRERSGDGKPSSRTIDLDLILYGGLIIDTPELQVPHPRMAQRRFVLQPLADLRPDLVPPQHSQTVYELLQIAPPDESIKNVREGKRWAK